MILLFFVARYLVPLAFGVLFLGFLYAIKKQAEKPDDDVEAFKKWKKFIA